MTLRRLLSGSGALAGVLAFALATHACAHGGDGEPKAHAASKVRIASSAPASARAWGAPEVSGRPGDYRATLKPSGQAAQSAKPVSVRVEGIGYPGAGKGAGARFVGPGVAMPWTQIAHNRYDVSIGHRGSSLGLRIWSRGGKWRAKVDGRLVDRRPRPVGSDYALHTIALDFRDADPQKRHVVDFQLQGGAWLAGVTAGEGDEVWLPRKPRGPSIYWLGDSFFAGGGSSAAGFADLVHVASDRLGLEDVTVDALGGTGYVRDNTIAHFDDYLTRARRNLGAGRAQPDVIVVGGSINDVTANTTQLTSAATRLFRYLDQAVPRAKVVVVPFAPHYPVPANFRRGEQDVLRAAAKAPNVVGTFDLPARFDESPRLQGRDGHPTQAGHRSYGRAIADFLKRKVPALNR